MAGYSDITEQKVVYHNAAGAEQEHPEGEKEESKSHHAQSDHTSGCGYSISGVLETWKFSRGGNFSVFRDIAFFAKISPARKLNPYDVIKEIRVVS